MNYARAVLNQVWYFVSDVFGQSGESKFGFIFSVTGWGREKHKNQYGPRYLKYKAGKRKAFN